MKLRVEIAGQKLELMVDLRDDHAVATIGDRSYEVELREIDSGQYLLKNGLEVFECRVYAEPKKHNVFQVELRGASYQVRVTDPKRLRSGETTGGQNHGVARIVASMPGKVVRVLVEEGATVEPGTGILVVEAMKMQNEMKSPKGGTVVSLKAVAGSTVNAGDVLAIVE